MRTLPLVALACLLTGCLVQPPPKDAGDGGSKADKTASAAEKPDPKAKEPEPAPERLMPPPPPEGLKGIDLVGHGLRVTMYPPFQISLADDFVPEFAEKGATNGLILSWWNASDPKAGGPMGTVGLYNAGAAVHPVPEGDPTIQEIELAWPDGKKGVAYRLGETGSYVLLPPELLGAGGMLTVAPGPSDPVWAMEVDGVRTELVPKRIVHSADPAEGPGFVIDGNPHKPWGPWLDEK